MKTEKLTLYGTVIAEAEKLFEITLEEIHWRRRYPRIIRARQWVWMVLHDSHHWSYPEIGRAMGFDHSTVLDGARKARKWHAANTQSLPTLSPMKATVPRWSSCASVATAGTGGVSSMPTGATRLSCSLTEEKSGCPENETLADAATQEADGAQPYEAELAGEALAI